MRNQKPNHAAVDLKKIAKGALRAPTLTDVAREAGFSLGMASRVISNYGSFSETTRTRVLKAAAKLGYRRNGVARSLRIRKTYALGVLINEISTYHWTVFVQGVEETAKRAGYHVILCNTADNGRLEREYLDALHERGVDGIIASPLSENRRYFSKLVASGFPIVLVNSNFANLRAARISAGDQAAATAAVDYLVGLGHRRIGLVVGQLALDTGRRRLDGYKRALEMAKIPFDEDLVTFGNYAVDQAYDATLQLIKLPDAPTAIVMCSEKMTGAALKCLKDYKVRIPSEISLVAFDDPPWASFYDPAITSLREQRFEMGTLACDALIDGILNPNSNSERNRELILQTELIVRDSCGTPRCGPLRAIGPKGGNLSAQLRIDMCRVSHED